MMSLVTTSHCLDYKLNFKMIFVSSLYLYSKAPPNSRVAFQSFWSLLFQSHHHHYGNEENEWDRKLVAGCFLLLDVRGMKAMSSSVAFGILLPAFLAFLKIMVTFWIFPEEKIGSLWVFSH